MEPFEASGRWWDPRTPDTKWPGTLRYNPSEGSIVTLTVPPPNVLFVDNLAEYEVLLGETTSGKEITLLRCFHRRHAEIFANTTIVGFHTDSPDPLISAASVVFQHLNEWWGPSAIRADPNVRWPNVLVGYNAPEKVILNDGASIRVSLHSGLGMAFEQMKCSLKEEIRLEFDATEPQPLSVFQSRIHACKDLLSVACLTVCEVEELRLVPASEDQSRKSVGTFHAVPIFKDPSEHVSWPDFLFRYCDIQERPTDIFAAWLRAAEQLRVVRSLYLSATYGKAFLEMKLLTLAQAVEAYHRRSYGGADLYMEPDEFTTQICNPMKASIPHGIDPSLRQSLRSRLEYGNEYSFRKRLTVLFTEHESALGFLVPRPADWINRIVDHRNSFTHHPVIHHQAATEQEELLRCVYVLRVLIEQCFLSSMNLTVDERTKLTERCEKYRKIKERFFK